LKIKSINESASNNNSGPNFNQNAAQIKSAASVKDKMLECVGQFGDPIMKLNHNDSSVKK
jgi:hypothetical protein